MNMKPMAKKIMDGMKDIPLPPGVKLADLEWRSPPKSAYGTKKYDEWRQKNAHADPREITFYYTERFGWVITTLRIAAGRTSERSYGIDLKGNLVRVGNGPHVKKTLRVQIYEDRLEDLQKYVDLYNKGLEAAGDTRDRISTRRAQTAQRRRDFGFFR